MFRDDFILFRLTALQPINQTDAEPQAYDKQKKAVQMRTVLMLDTNGKRVDVPFVSAESLVHQWREALWRHILAQFGYTLRDFRNPVGAILTYLMINGGDTSIGRKLDAVDDFDRVAQMPSRFPPLGAFGFTANGIFFPSLVRVSFLLPYTTDLPFWAWARDQFESNSPDAPKPFSVRQCLARATADDQYHHAISYFRHPDPSGPFWGRKDPKTSEDAKSPNTTLELQTFDPMPHTFSYIPPGTPLAFTLQFDETIPPVTASAVRYALDRWVSPQGFVTLGAHANRGFGLASVDNYPPNAALPTADLFQDWLATHHDALATLLERFTHPDKALAKSIKDAPEALFALVDELFSL